MTSTEKKIAAMMYHAAMSDIIDTEDLKTYLHPSPFSDQLPVSFLHNELICNNLLYFNFTEYLLTISVLKSFAKGWRNRMYIVSWNISRNIESVFTKPVVVLIVIVLLTLAIISQNVSINLAYAETGTGTDIFKVIMSVFGVEESRGDVVTLVTVNNQESKVKFFDASGSELIPMNASGGNGHILEYVATFPNVTVNSGDEYKACVLTVKDMNLKCGTGHNSPTNRPEFIDINLDGTIATESEPLGMDGTIRSMEDEMEVTTAATSAETS